MARVNITIPDELHELAKEAGLNISQLTRRGIVEELDRRAKIAALDTYLADLDAELGPVGESERAAAEAWAERVFGPRAERSRPA
ncbi:MAG: type II toxin-antitoxin system CcdA family antitoxin [Acidimicrobiales bacterium]